MNDLGFFWVPLTVVLSAVAIRLFEDKPASLKVIAALAVALNAILVPLLTFTSQTPVTNVVVFFLLGWLASFKVLGKAFGRGPLCFYGLTMLGTLTTYALPINPVSKAKTTASSSASTSSSTPPSATSTLEYAWGAALHVLLLIFCTSLSHRLQQQPYGPTGYVHMLLSDLVNAFNLYAFIAIIMNVASIVTAWAGESLLGFSEIMPHCDRPYVLTTSTDVRPDALTYLSPFHALTLQVVGDQLFRVLVEVGTGRTRPARARAPYSHSLSRTSPVHSLARRWNANTGQTLRYLVYDPVIEGSMERSKPPQRARPRANVSDARRAVALAAAFFVSGIMHELFILFLRSQHSGRARWFLFFFLQAPIIIWVDPIIKRIGAVSPLAARVVTIGAQLLIAHHLFFVPVVELGIADDVRDDIHHGIKMLLGERLSTFLYPHR